MGSIIYHDYKWVDYDELIADIKTKLSKEAINFLNLLKRKTKGMVLEDDLIYAVHKLSNKNFPEKNMLKTKYKVIVLNDLIDYVESATLYKRSYMCLNQLLGEDEEMAIPLLNIEDEFSFGRKRSLCKVWSSKRYQKISPRFCLHKPSIHIKFYHSWYDDPARPQDTSAYTSKLYLYIYLPRNFQKNNNKPNYIK